MSYLDPPNLHFFGQFWTDPSTINNATENYDLQEVYNNEPPSTTNPNSVWWNKNGQHFFKLLDCTVNSASNQDDQVMFSSGDDSIVGAELVSVVGGSVPPAQWGRLVDLDPDQQSRSLIVGLNLQVTIPSEPGVSFVGEVRPMTILDLWGRITTGGGGQGIESAGCMYQSVLENIQWSSISNTKSNVLKQLHAVSQENGNLLSFKMVVDGYNGDITSDQFNSGRVVGTIGPYNQGEPAHFIAQRRAFNGSEAVVADYPNGSPMNPAPFQVRGNKLILDFGNSVQTTAPRGGPFVDLGTVNAVIDPTGTNPIVLQPALWSTPDQFSTQYELSAGIFELDLGANAGAVLKKSLGIQISPPSDTTDAITGLSALQLKIGLPADSVPVQTSSAKVGIALAEWQDGYYVDVDFNALRLQNGAPQWDAAALTGTEITANAQIPLYATQWGAAAPNLAVNFTTAINQYQFPNSEGNPYNINNTPMSAVSFPGQVTTGPNGQINIECAANPLSKADKDQAEPRRDFVDGQLYLYTFTYSKSDTSMDNSGQPITLLVFESLPFVADPTWWQDVHPIFLQYARLYPAMRDLIDLSDYATVTDNSDPFNFVDKIKGALSLPMSHPALMPVTRDLSLLKKDMIMRWYANGMKEGTPPANG